MSYREITINGQQIKLIPLGDCACGCGEKTNLIKKNCTNPLRVKGQPCKYIRNHQHVGKAYNQGKSVNAGDKHWHWKGGKINHCEGYNLIHQPGHARAHKNRYVLEHIAVATKVLGKPLPPKAEIHHVNEDKKDNRHDNLVICQDRAYHKLLHQRMKAYKTCGHANWRKCQFCHKYDDPINMYVRSNAAWHNSCCRKHKQDQKRLMIK